MSAFGRLRASGILIAMSMTGTVPVRCVLVYMALESEYLANANDTRQPTHLEIRHGLFACR
jgi:hypothetical protein